MEWIKIKDSKPVSNQLVYAKNENGLMDGVLALYYVQYDAFVNYDPSYRISLTLEVTHWYPLPE